MSDRKPVVEGITTITETAAHRLLALEVEAIQQFFRLDSVSFAAIIGLTLGEMLAQADAGSEKRMNLTGLELEPLKQTMLLNFEVAYNRTRSELAEPVKPKKGVI